MRLEARLTDPAHFAAVFTTTYVEVWWLSGCYVDTAPDVMTWLDEIIERRVACWRPPADRKARYPVSAADFAERRSRYAAMELAELLGRPVETLGLRSGRQPQQANDTSFRHRA